jgi:hypothetical protein
MWQVARFVRSRTQQSDSLHERADNVLSLGQPAWKYVGSLAQRGGPTGPLRGLAVHGADRLPSPPLPSLMHRAWAESQAYVDAYREATYAMQCTLPKA